jgi:predicted regulator of Ras-like GTPase activity (Roadblock/LC7/MglB family)
MPPEEGMGEVKQPTSGDFIQVPLKTILLKVPSALAHRVRQAHSQTVLVPIPLQKILPQLAQGSVKISFGELRQAAPAGVFSDLSDQDQTAIELPLAAILPQVKPEFLPRRTDQRRVEIPSEVSAIFGAKGQGLTSARISSTPAKAPSPEPSAPTEPHPADTPPPFAPRPAPTAQPATPLKPVAPVSVSPIKPSVPLPSPAALRAQAPPPPPPPPAVQPIRPTVPLPTPPAVTPRPPTVSPAAAAPVAGPFAAPAPVTPLVSQAVPTEPLSIPLTSVAVGWPEAIRQELAGLPGATVSLPVEEIEQALKRGKIAFPWKRLRSWIRPLPSPTAVASLDETSLELPLAVIAPVYLTRRRPVAPQKKYAMTEHIPDVFASRGMVPGGQVAEPPARPVPAAHLPRAPAPAPAPAPPLAPAPAPAPAPVSATTAPEDIGELFGQPGRKNWTPSELVQRASLLKGVAGALIAMQDGLMVASHLPPGLNGETIAAFIPQMFGRMMQYSKELKFSQANNMTIIVDDIPLKIFRSGGVYFIVLGRAGEPLPEPHLSIVAAQLGPQNR